MKVLAIETSTLTGSVALLEIPPSPLCQRGVMGGFVIGEVTLSVSLQHSERLMPAIADLLRDAAVAPSEVDLYAVAIGPGSFTGLRIGLAAAQGLPLAHDKPVVGVSTLEGIAFHGVYYPGVVVPLLNAYRNELYWGLYRGVGGVPKVLEEDRVSPVEELISWVRHQSERCLLLGDGLKVYGERLMAELGPEKIDLAPAHLQNPRGAHIAVLAVEKSRQGHQPEPLPKYLRRPG